MFENVQIAPPDPILGLTEMFKADPNPNKINLSVGVYQDANGKTPVLNTVKEAEKLILEQEDEKLGDAIRIGQADGMQDYTLSLKNLVEGDLIDRQVAFDIAPSPDVLKMALKGIDISQRGIL